MLPRPAPDEHAPYFSTYIDQVPDGDITELLATQVEQTIRLLAAVAPERETYRYAPGKWSVREVIGHVIDTERVFAARALWFARKAEGAMPSMDQNPWAATSNAGARPLADLIAELRAVREASLALFASFDDEIWLRRGVASGNEFTVRAIAWIIAGHERHHRAILQREYGL
ncbi:MAG: DinB family protein [Gemmatimonadota bacterium]|jgi:hypothetical protein